MFALEWVQPGTATARDFELLEKADQAGPDFQLIPLLQIDHALKQSRMHLFRYTAGEGVVLVEVVQGASGIKRLLILRTAGKDVIWQFGRVAELLKHTAREWGCEAIETMVYSHKIAKALSRVGAKAEAVNMVLGVD